LNFQCQKSDKRNILVYRYIRPLAFDEIKNETKHSLAGGISFRFDIDHSLNLLIFSFVRCADNIKFDNNFAKNILNNKMHNSYLISSFSSELSLIKNVEGFIKGSKEKELKDLYKHLKQIYRHNEAINQFANNFYSKVTEKVKVEYELT
jgi:hypothetical protein